MKQNQVSHSEHINMIFVIKAILVFWHWNFQDQQLAREIICNSSSASVSVECFRFLPDEIFYFLICFAILRVVAHKVTILRAKLCHLTL
jgi:hypothetical protein